MSSVIPSSHAILVIVPTRLAYSRAAFRASPSIRRFVSVTFTPGILPVADLFTVFCMTSVPFAREGSRLRLVSTVWPSRWARHPALADGASTRHRMPAAASHTLRTRNPAHQQSRSGSQVRLQRYPMTADIRLAVSVIQTVFAQNHRAAATAADDHANTPNNKKSPSPSHS